jgi:hypothetical protein
MTALAAQRPPLSVAAPVVQKNIRPSRIYAK